MADGGLKTAEIVPDAANARVFRDALGRFATGVTVVTIQGPDGPMGFTANSFSSLSLDPALVLWSPAKASQRYPFFAAASHYAIHVLGQHQSDLPARFSRGGSGFDGLDWHRNSEGVPVLPGALARFDCAQHATHDGGDHLIIVGQVLRLALEEGEPLVFAKGRFGSFTG
ncbi:flavin reductase family protein [Tabrizicola sp.]|uniref:flavin reductase family protein n=1 Tax=Tabrizicola sp. TaxID=2005166 RepID=UPI002736066F|nr:flavin reductase family protein [Tabrizicola sp.]MDP3195278.1 flavin reductase family protein [Tabrizicola sp.]